MVSRDQKYKRWLFLASYTFFAAVNMAASFFGSDNNSMKKLMAAVDTSAADSPKIGLIRNISIALMFGICFVLLLSMDRRRSSRSRPVSFLIGGLSLWLVWGIFIQFGGLALWTTAEGSRAIIKLCVFTVTLVMAISIAEAYSLKKEIVGISAFIIGTGLLGAYITHFNGLEFLDSFANVLAQHDRYRVSFGLSHYNAVGRLSLYYFIYTAIYRALLEEKQQSNYLPDRGHTDFKSDALYKYLLCISPVIVIMLISSASRTSISSIMGFWLMYYALGRYPKIRTTTKAMLIIAALFICLVLAAALDLGKIWADFISYSNRGANYTTTFPILTQKSTWLAGLGFGFKESFNRLRTIVYLDSFYVYTLMETGLVGFFLLIGTILSFSFIYFRNIRYMTKFHRLAGGLLSVMLWYALF